MLFIKERGLPTKTREKVGKNNQRIFFKNYSNSIMNIQKSIRIHKMNKIFFSIELLRKNFRKG